MNPMKRMFAIGIVNGIGFCNVMWMFVDFHPVSLVVTAACLIALILLYRDHATYYEGAS